MRRAVNVTFTVVKERNLDRLARAIGLRDLWVKAGDSVTVSLGPHSPTMVRVNRHGRSIFTWDLAY